MLPSLRRSGYRMARLGRGEEPRRSTWEAAAAMGGEEHANKIAPNPPPLNNPAFPRLIREYLDEKKRHAATDQQIEDYLASKRAQRQEEPWK